MVYIMEYYWAIQKNKIMPFVATWIELEIILLRKEERERLIPYDITFTWNIKYGRNEPIYKTETDSQRTDLWFQGGGEKGQWRFGSLGLAAANCHI